MIQNDTIRNLEELLEFMEANDTSELLREDQSYKVALRREADLYTLLQTLKESLLKGADHENLFG